MTERDSKRTRMARFLSLLLTTVMLVTAQGFITFANTVSQNDAQNLSVEEEAGENIEVGEVDGEPEMTLETHTQAAVPANPVHHCTKAEDGTDYTDFSYVYFGSYPQSEVRDSTTIAAIDSAIATGNATAAADMAGVDVWVNGTKYRRIAKVDTNYSGYFDDVENNGYRYFKWECIKWRVLNNDDNGTLFVMADKVLDCKAYHDDGNEITWENSTIRSWLNGSFYQSAFSSAEQSAITPWKFVNGDNPNYGTEGSNDTTERVYLLSIEEVTNESYGFCSAPDTWSASRRLQASNYARVRGTYTATSSDLGFQDTCWWWPRKSSYHGAAPVVDCAGAVGQDGHSLYYNNDGVAPALHINLSSDLWSMVDDGSSGDGGNGNQANPSNSSISYYQQNTKRLFRVMKINNKSYPAPAGFEVSVGTEKFSSGRTETPGTDDINVIIPSDYVGDVKVSKEGYFDYKIPAKYTGRYNVITMTPTSVKTPFVQTLLMGKPKDGRAIYSNVLTENGTMYQRRLTDTKEEIVSIYPQVEWNGHGAGEVWLEQGEVKVPLQNNNMQTFDWNKYFFVANKTIYLCAKASDGTGFKAATKINVYEKYNPGMPINLGKTVTLDTSEAKQSKMDIFSGEKIKFDFSKLSDGLIPCQLSIKNDGTIEGVLGLQVFEEEETVAAYGKMKESINELRKLKKLKNPSDKAIAKQIAKIEKEARSIGCVTTSSGSFGVSGDIQVLGYLTGKIENVTENGKERVDVNIQECKIVLVGEGKASYSYNTVILNCPAYFKATLKAEIEWYIKLCNQEVTYDVSSGDGEYVDTTISLSLEAGPGWEGYISGGAKGTGSVKISNKLPTDENNTVCSLSAGFSFVGTLGGLSGEWNFYNTPEMVFWDGDWCWKDKDKLSAETVCFVPDLTTTEMKLGTSVNDEMITADTEAVTVNEGDSFVTGINGYAAPTVAQIGEKMLVVWSADVQGRSAVDSKGIYYSICDNGTWTMPALVDDDGTNDSIPQLQIKDDTVYLAWQNYTEKFETDELPEYETISAQMETVVSVFDKESCVWSTPSVQTPEWYLSIPEIPESYQKELPTTYNARKIFADMNQNLILYTAADENEIAQVYGIFQNDEEWALPIQISKYTEDVLGFDAVYDGDRITLVCVTGEYEDAALSLFTWEESENIDIALEEVYYDGETLVPEGELMMQAFVKNHSPYTIDGFQVSIQNEGEEVYSGEIEGTLCSGEEDIFDIPYELPKQIDFEQLTLTITPLAYEDIDMTNNTKNCVLNLTDLSLEYASAIKNGDTTKVVVQVVNRGQKDIEQATKLTFRKDASDGEVIKTVDVLALVSGGLENIETDVLGLEKGDMIYVEASGLSNENLIGNNETQMVVVGDEDFVIEMEQIEAETPDKSDDDNNGTENGGGTQNSMQPVTKISISGISKKIAAGKKVQLTAKVAPKNASNKAVTWKSSNTKYATVTASGKVAVKKAGAGKTVTITAMANDGSGVKASYKIKIMKHAVKSVKLSAASKTVSAGKSVKIKAAVKTTGKNANMVLKWTVSNSKYATVSKTGKVKTKKAGRGKTITVTAAATDGSGKKGSIKIKIK